MSGNAAAVNVEAEEGQLCVVLPVPGKGNGLVATTAISLGTRILCEEPIIMLPASVTLGDPLYWNCLIEQVEKLSEQQRGVFLSMQNNFNYRSEVAVHGWYMGIAHTASVPCEDVNGLQARGIFPKASFINHACDPNTVRHWNTNIRKHTIHATRDIVQGQEITVDYLGTMEPRAPRQKHLRDNYKFDCLCRLCSLPPELSRLKDESFTELERLESLVARRGLTNNLTALESLRCVEAMVKIYDQPAPQGINMGPGQHQPVLPWVYGDAAKIALECSDLARAQMFLKRAVAGWRVSYGDDSQEVTENERYLENLTLHPHYSKNGLWRTSVDDVPRGINTAHLQDWLWRRAKLIDPAATRTMSPLRSRLAFPPAAHLPTDESLRLALRYYGFDQPLASRPRRHWCFLGEITSYAFEERLDVGVTDVDGKTVEINWHTRERGRELDDALVTEGNTIALLHAERRAETVRGQRFPIVKHEDHTKLLIFPIGLQALLAMSDEVHQFATMQDGVTTCHGCGTEGSAMFRCTMCSTFWYCSHACQAVGWNEKKHMETCELLQCSHLKQLITGDWNTFNGYLGFGTV